MSSRDPRIDAYIAKSAPFARPILTYIRKAVHAGCPDVEETMKWSFPHFMYKGMLCSMASFKEHCAFGFWKGSLLEGNGARTKDAMGQFGRITSVSDLPGEKALVKLVKRAAALNDEGVSVVREKRATPPVKTPPDLMAALRANATYEGFSQSMRREYVDWITDARTEETRTRRLETAVEWMAEGKPRNWKYL
ncbi:MAG: hypothetical protein DMF86_20490 [Acidobacteria bacterium]|nr:MAG: hypothetical protein DMF86_20490 [Acidobacteriota bacterium]